MIGLICNVLFIYIWSSCSPASRNSYICKVPTAGINRRSDYFANSPAINTYNTIDNGINSATPSDDEKELAVTADIEEKILNLAEKSELEALTDNSNEDLLQRMHLSGVVRLDDLIPEEVVLKLVDFIRTELKESIIDVKNGKVQPLQRFSNMLSSANRWDLKIPLENPIVMETMKTMFRRDGPLGQLMTSLVSENGELFELAAFCTSSGASRQVMHADTLWSKQPALYTCAVALQDVTEDMGPTLFIPGSHTKAIHKKFDSRKTKGEVLTGSPHVLSTLRSGDMSIYDSRVLHCGTPNISSKERILMYATFRNPKGPKSDSDFWNVASIRPEYVGKYCLKEFL